MKTELLIKCLSRRMIKVDLSRSCHAYKETETSIKSGTRTATRRKYISRMNIFPFQTVKDKDGLGICNSYKLLSANDVFHGAYAGHYHYMPLGQRVLDKLIRLIDEELDAVGCQKMSMPTIIQANLLQKTDRWGTPELFKLSDRHGKSFCLAPTHEEIITQLVSEMIPSHKRLPIMLYQISRKFRDEKRPRFGLLRSREFEMKDLYTFDQSEEAAKNTYQLISDAYHRIFDRLDVPYVKVVGSTGDIGGSMSHEFHFPSAIGEDTLYTCDKCSFGLNSEMAKSDEEGALSCPECQNTMTKTSGIEVGHCFLLGTKYSRVLQALCINEHLKKVPIEMGCYGLGVSRILQASAEVLSTDTHIRWPSLIAPYQVCILPQKQGYKCAEFLEMADRLYDNITSIPQLRSEVVIDDRVDQTVGKRMAQANCQGFPYMVIINRKTLETPARYEVMDEYNDTKDFLSLEQMLDKFSQVQSL